MSIELPTPVEGALMMRIFVGLRNNNVNLKCLAKRTGTASIIIKINNYLFILANKWNHSSLIIKIIQ